MKKIKVFMLIGLALILSACTTDNTSSEKTNKKVVNDAVNNINENTNTNTATNNNEQTTDLLVDWKTFTNIAGKYAFNYPTTWNAAVNKNNEKDSLFGLNANTGTGLGGVELRNFTGSVSEYVKYLEENAAINYTSKKNTTINGQTAIEVDYTGVANQLGHGIYFKNGNQAINIFINTQDKKDIELFNKLLSTFKITN